MSSTNYDSAAFLEWLERHCSSVSEQAALFNKALQVSGEFIASVEELQESLGLYEGLSVSFPSPEMNSRTLSNILKFAFEADFNLSNAAEHFDKIAIAFKLVIDYLKLKHQMDASDDVAAPALELSPSPDLEVEPEQPDRQDTSEEDKPMPRSEVIPPDKPEPEPEKPEPEIIPTPIAEVRQRIIEILTKESPLTRAVIQARLVEAGVVFKNAREVATVSLALRDDDRFVCPASRIGWKIAKGTTRQPEPDNKFGQLIYELLRAEQPRTVNNICACLADSGVKMPDGSMDERVRHTLAGRREFRQLPTGTWVLTSYQPPAPPPNGVPTVSPAKTPEKSNGLTVQDHRRIEARASRRKEAEAPSPRFTMRPCPRCKKGQMVKQREIGTYGGDWHWNCAQCGYDIDPDATKINEGKGQVADANAKTFLGSLIPALSAGWNPTGLLDLDVVGEISREGGSGLNQRDIYRACQVLGTTNKDRMVIADDLLDLYIIGRQGDGIVGRAGNDMDVHGTSGHDVSGDDIGDGGILHDPNEYLQDADEV